MWLVSRGTQFFAMKAIEIDLNAHRNYLRDLKEYFIHLNDIVRSIKHNSILYIYGIAMDVSDEGSLRTNVVMDFMKHDLRAYIRERLNID